jgi:branched-chain amino acid transport system ATP-binding protein
MSWLSQRRIHCASKSADNLLSSFDLIDVAEQQTSELSSGKRKRLEIALALATEASLILLDEPMAGLSEPERQRVGKMMRDVAAEHSVVFVEHDIDMVMSLSDHVFVLHNGQIIASGSPEQVRSNQTVKRVYLERDISHA